MALQIYDPATGLTRDATTNDFSAQRPLTPLGSVIAITVTTTSQTLAVLAGALDTTCNWISLQLRDDQNTGQIVRINYNGTASDTAYDQTLSLDTSRPDPAQLTGKGSKALFEAFQVVANASAVVLVRQYREG
jgi:hypothetical protein